MNRGRHKWRHIALLSSSWRIMPQAVSLLPVSESVECKCWSSYRLVFELQIVHIANIRIKWGMGLWDGWRFDEMPLARDERAFSDDETKRSSLEKVK